MDVKKIIKEEISKLSEKQKLKILHGQELEEARMKKVTERMWKYMSDDKRFDALLSVVKDPSDAEKLIDTNWKDLPSGFERDMTIYEGKLTEAKYKVGDTVTVKTGANTYKGKIENLSPFRIRTSPSETMVIPNKAIKSIVKEGKLTERKLPKRFTVVNKFRVDGQVFNTGDYAKKKERMGKTMVLNMDNSEMLSIDYQDYIAAVNNKHIQEGKLTEAREFVIIDPRGNARPVGHKSQGNQFLKKMGGARKGWFMVLAKNALKARRAIEKAGGSFSNSKLQDTMFDLMYEGKLTESGILYRAGVKKYGKEGMTKIQQAAGKGEGHEEIGKIKDKYEKGKTNEEDELTESNINLDTDKLGIVENLTNKEMMDLIKALKMRQDRPMLTWKSPGDGVHVMVVQSGAVKAIFPHKGDVDEAKTAMKILKVKGLKVIGELNERLDHEKVMDILDAAAGYTSTAHVAANQQWWDAQDLYDYLISDHIPKKFHKKFFKSIGKTYKLKETINLRKIFMKGRKKKRTKDEGKLNEKLARGLKPLLVLGSNINKKVGEDALVKLSDKFDKIDDEYAGEIASWLDMAIELMQDGYPGDATKKLKQFNKKCKDVLKGKSIKSAFAEGKIKEAEYGTPTGTKTLKSIDAKFDDAVFKVPPHKITRDWVLKIAKKYKVDPKKAIQWVNLNPKINIKEGVIVMKESVSSKKPKLGKLVKNIRDIKPGVNYTIYNKTSMGDTWITGVNIKKIGSGMDAYTFYHTKEKKMAIMLGKKAVINYIKDKNMFLAEGKLTEIKKGDYVEDYGEIGSVNKVKGKAAYIKFPGNPHILHPVEIAVLKHKGKHKGKDLYLHEGKLNEVTAKDMLQHAVNALTKTFGGKKLDQRYVKDYLKSIEQMARKNPGKFVKDYGKFKFADWIEDAEYNLQNEGKISTKRLSEIIIEEYEKLLARKNA